MVDAGGFYFSPVECPAPLLGEVFAKVEAIGAPLEPSDALTHRLLTHARARRFGEVPQVPFAVSVPLGKAAPDDIWRRLGNRVRARGPGAPAGYGDPLGEIELREAVVDYVRKSRSVRCEASQVIITSGTQQGLYLACQVLLDVGDFAWVEDPAYRGITAILESAGHSGQMVRVPVDARAVFSFGFIFLFWRGRARGVLRVVVL